jgi:hypothetical protein
MSQIRRISLFGGPGCGKSRTKSFLVSQLKKQGVNVSEVDEWVKEWAYMKVEISGFDQLFIFANQLRKEELKLKNGENLIVSDSPVFLPVYYSIKYDFEGWQHLADITALFEQKYPSLNIFLDREGVEYRDVGRWETEEEADLVDEQLKNLLDDQGVEYVTLNTLDEDEILNYVLENIR